MRFDFSYYFGIYLFANAGGHGKRSEIPIDLSQQIPIEKTFATLNKDPLVSIEIICSAAQCSIHNMHIRTITDFFLLQF